MSKFGSFIHDFMRSNNENYRNVYDMKKYSHSMDKINDEHDLSDPMRTINDMIDHAGPGGLKDSMEMLKQQYAMQGALNAKMAVKPGPDYKEGTGTLHFGDVVITYISTQTGYINFFKSACATQIQSFQTAQISQAAASTFQIEISTGYIKIS